MALGAAAVGPPLSDEHVRALAREILARPEYARWRARPFAWLSQLGEWLQQLTDWLTHLYFTAPALYWTLLVLLLLVSGALLAHVAVSLRSALGQPSSAGSLPTTDDDPNLFERAEALARQGLFLEAARYIQLAAIDLLIRRGMLELSRADANRILRRRLGEAALPATEREELVRLLDRLETRWFRDRTQDRALYESWRSLYARLGVLPEAA